MWLFLGNGWFAVFGSAEGEDEQEDVGEKNEANLEAGAFLEGFTELDGGEDVKEDVVASIEDGHDGAKGGELAGVSDVASGDGE